MLSKLEGLVHFGAYVGYKVACKPRAQVCSPFYSRNSLLIKFLIEPLLIPNKKHLMIPTAYKLAELPCKSPKRKLEGIYQANDPNYQNTP